MKINLAEQEWVEFYEKLHFLNSIICYGLFWQDDLNIIFGFKYLMIT